MTKEELKRAFKEKESSKNYEVKYIEKLCKEIDKLKQENEELKEKEKNLLLQLKDSEKELLEVTQNIVSKDKIRNKIKELEEKFTTYKFF